MTDENKDICPETPENPDLPETPEAAPEEPKEVVSWYIPQEPQGREVVSYYVQRDPMPQNVWRNSFSRIFSLFSGSIPIISWPKSLTIPTPA